ncbi:MAG: sulfite exporter TauE/SafE family protein [Burkholderiales bacterium]
MLLVAYLVRGIAGFGSGLIAVPLLALVAPMSMVVPLVVCLDYVGSASQGLRNRQAIAWKELIVLLPFTVIGVATGLLILNYVSTEKLAKALGCFVIVYAMYQLIVLPVLRASRIAATYCGFLGGLMGSLFNAGGPFYIIYFSMRTLDKTVLRSTFAANYLVDGAIRLGAYAAIGLFNRELLVHLLIALPLAAVALFAGGHVHTGLSQKVFVRFISLLLVASGALLILRN